MAQQNKPVWYILHYMSTYPIIHSSPKYITYDGHYNFMSYIILIIFSTVFYCKIKHTHWHIRKQHPILQVICFKSWKKRTIIQQLNCCTRLDDVSLRPFFLSFKVALIGSSEWFMSYHWLMHLGLFLWNLHCQSPGLSAVTHSSQAPHSKSLGSIWAPLHHT